MPTACIQQPGSQITLKSERLIVSFKDDDGFSHKREIPLHDLERLILSESTSISTPALAQVLHREIPVSLVSHQGRFLGSFQPATLAHGAARLQHYQRTLDPSFALTISILTISAKIYNQRRLIQRIATSRQASGQAISPHIPTTIAALNRALNTTARATTLESLRGHEGSASARYFSAWSTLLPDEFPFERRSTRPPLNPVNAVLSYASTLIYHEMHSFIHARGLDPSLGLLHTTENGRWSLALDLMEPFRPILVEALTLDLFSHKMLNPTHFEPQNGGIYLTREGRAKLLLQYEKRMDRQFMSEFAGHRTTLRQQLENQATLFKSALNDPTTYTPFHMN